MSWGAATAQAAGQVGWGVAILISTFLAWIMGSAIASGDGRAAGIIVLILCIFWFVVLTVTGRYGG